MSFQLAKARLVGLTAEPQELVAAFESSKAADRPEEHAADAYAASLAYIALNRSQEARRILERLPPLEDHEVTVQLALAKTWEAEGEYERAAGLLGRLDAIHPNYAPIVFHLVDVLVAKGEPCKALELAERLARGHPREPEVFRLEAKAAARCGREVQSYEAMAEHYRLMVQPAATVEQLQLALKQPGLDPVTRARLDSKLDEARETLRRLANN
jgi:predicted Zn-dependent protease